jgi:hypothetical protein
LADAQLKSGAKTRSVWVWADAHGGLEVDGRDAAEWAELALAELLDNVGRPDYVLELGDVAHAYKEEQFRRYARMRDTSGIPLWFQIVGNHDFHGTENGLYQKYVGWERDYVLVDGNLAWVMVSAERGRACGILHAPTRRWLKRVLGAYRDRNIVLCSHQVPAHTLRRSHPAKNIERILTPVPWVSDLRRHCRVDGWLCGHEHGPPRDGRQAVRVGRTTFINVASISKAYHTKASVSFVLEMREGERVIHARCRNHDERRFVADFSIDIPIPFPLRLGEVPVIRDVVRLPRPSD